MLESYSVNVAVEAESVVPFNAISIIKGCTATHPSIDTFNLNRSGVYMVAVNASSAISTTLQLYKDGVAQPQAQSTGLNPSFVTLVQVSKNNCNCDCCSSPVSLQVMNSVAGTLTDVNITITKVC